MTDETTVKEPRTEPGKDLAASMPSRVMTNGGMRTWPEVIAAIEDEARSAVLAEVRAAVEGLPTHVVGPHGRARFAQRMVNHEAVLDLIDHISEDK